MAEPRPRRRRAACDASGPILPFLVAVAAFVASFLVLLRIREPQHLES